VVLSFIHILAVVEGNYAGSRAMQLVFHGGYDVEIDLYYNVSRANYVTDLNDDYPILKNRSTALGVALLLRSLAVNSVVDLETVSLQVLFFLLVRPPG